MVSSRGRKWTWSLALALAATACSGRPADTAGSRTASVKPVTDAKASAPARRGGAPIHALVQLTERPTAVAYRTTLTQVARGGTTADATAVATDAAVQQLSAVATEQAAFTSRVAAAAIPGTTELFRLQRIYNGVVYVTDEAGLARLRATPGARAVHELTLHEQDNARGVPVVGVPQLWALGVPLKGNGIRVGVIDTGIDYLHANFGGPGTVAAFDANDPNLVEPGSFPTAKVVGGWDFAGAAYDARFAASSFPLPDADPVDRSGHGSHVAGTVAGLGVTAAGATYAGPYDLTLDPTTLRIGPGAAPGASLYALKVFGDGGGSTALSALGIEWATDPNGDGDFADHLDVVNLSLGSAYGSPNDSDAIFYRNAVNAGVVVVTSAGNTADAYFITGSPGATPEVISVAATSVGAAAGLLVNSPPAVAGVKAVGGASPPAAFQAPFTRDLVLVDNPVDAPARTDTHDGCQPFTNAAAVAGKIAFIHRGTCGFLLKAQNAMAAGAAGYLIGNVPTSSTAFPINMTVDATITIPGFLVANADRAAIEAAITGGATVNVTFDNNIVFQDPTAIDTIASFSSRGPTRLLGQPMLKPDVAAPGVSVVSTGMGTGNESANFSGTSMAAPLTAGVMALLKELHPDWTPAELKALVMNTAGHDVFNAPTTSATRLRLGPGRVGAGRVDAVAGSAASVIAYDKAAPERVSVSFATIDVATATTETRTVQLKNKGAAAVTYDVTLSSAVAPPGVTVTPGAATVTVNAGATADLTLALAADPAAMTRRRDPTTSTGGATPFGNLARNWLSEASGWVVLTPQGGGTTLRLPYYAAPIPASAMAASAPLATTTPAGTSTVALSGTGVDTSALAAAPAGVVSLATPFELAYASPRAAPVGGPLPVGYPSAEADIANLRYVGVTSNVADLGGDPTNAEIYFAVNTWAAWGSPAEVEFDIYLRAAGSPDWQYVLYNYDAGRFTANAPYTDTHMTVLQNLATGASSLEDFVNGVGGTQIFVPIYLADTMVLPVFASSVTGPGATALEYQVVAFSNRFGLVDVSPVLTYDLLAPAFSTTIDPALTTLGPGYTPFRVDAAGGTFDVAYDLDRARATRTGGLLVVHHHNANGQRAQAVAVQGLTCAANADCGGATPVCDTLTGACVGCTGNADCATGSCDVFGSRTCTAADCRDPAGPICAAHYSCSLDSGACLPNQAMIGTAVIGPGTACPAGGLQVFTGFDDSRNGVLDASEVLSTNYVCNGQSATVTPEAAGANCANGGVKVQVGTGAATYVCNGATGATGAAGESATATPEPAGANCANGGVKVQVGGGTPTYVCNGTNGTNGADGLSATTTPEPAGANCANGGLKVQVGGGTPAYVCNGAAGSDGTNGTNGTDGLSATVLPEPPGGNCAKGGVKVQVGSGAPSYACNGTTGATGPGGPAGPEGPEGPQGPKGASGCSSVGGGSSAFAFLGLGALLWRRRRAVAAR